MQTFNTCLLERPDLCSLEMHTPQRAPEAGQNFPPPFTFGLRFHAAQSPKGSLPPQLYQRSFPVTCAIDTCFKLSHHCSQSMPGLKHSASFCKALGKRCMLLGQVFSYTRAMLLRWRHTLPLFSCNALKHRLAR